MTPTKTDQTPVIRMSISREIAPNHQLILESYVANDCTKEELNGLLDKLEKAAGRQEALAILPRANLEVERVHKLAQECNDSIARIDTDYATQIEQSSSEGKRRTAPKMTHSAANERERSLVMLQRLRGEAQTATNERDLLRARLED